MAPAKASGGCGQASIAENQKGVAVTSTIPAKAAITGPVSGNSANASAAAANEATIVIAAHPTRSGASPFHLPVASQTI